MKWPEGSHGSGGGTSSSKEKQVATLSNRQATLSEVETKRQDLLDQVAKVKLALEKHYQELQEQVKGQFDFDFSEDYEAVLWASHAPKG